MCNKTWSAALALTAILSLLGPKEAAAEGAEAGVDFRYGSININNPVLSFFVGDDDISLIGLDLYARTEVARGLSIGGRLPIAHARFDDDTQTALGNITVELQYQLAGSLHNRSRVETSLSIATADDEGRGAQVAGVFGAFWIPDPGLYLPNTNTFRLMYHHEWNLQRNSHGNRGMAVEVDAGLHFLSIDEVDDRVRVPVRVTGRLGLSAQTEAMARFTTVWLSGTENDEDDFLHILEAGLDLAGVGRGNLELLVYMPLDDLYRDTFEVWGVTFGFRSSF